MSSAAAAAERPVVVLEKAQWTADEKAQWTAEDVEKPVIVHENAQWNFNLENFHIEGFFEEAKVTEEGTKILQSRFSRFCTSCKDSTGSAQLSLDDFREMNERYSICEPSEEDKFFWAMDRSGSGRLCFQDFLMGCAAANPCTPHILNSFTGYVRARYIFDFYNVSRSGTLEFGELAQLVADARRHLEEGPEARRAEASRLAQDLGDVSAITLRVHGLSGSLCDVRASARWTGLRVRREVARQLRVPVEGRELLLGRRPLLDEEVLDAFVPAGSTSAEVTLVRTNWDLWPCSPAPSASDGVVGLERLVHVTFQRFYRAIIGEQLRGTSKLFRFHRSILHTKKSALGGA